MCARTSRRHGRVDIFFAGPGRALFHVRAEVVVRDDPGFLVKLRRVARPYHAHDQLGRG